MPYVDARPSAPEHPQQTSSLVGRDHELNRLTRLLRQPDTRLVTLTGPGGVGKTRLALALSTRSPPSSRREWCFSISRRWEILPCCRSGWRRRSLCRSSADGRRLRRSPPIFTISIILLVFDNFEHLLPAAPNLITLLEQCPDLKIIVTSRERLRLGQERAFPVPPLAFPLPADSPEDDEPSAESLLSYPAIELFSNRAQSAWPDFAITPENAPVIVRICARLDGLPLALELAAARIGHISVEAMLARLERNFAILSQGSRDAPERQQTLDATISWSYKLLSEEEQRILRAMSIFEGSFTLEAMIFLTGPAVGFGTLNAATISSSTPSPRSSKKISWCCCARRAAAATAIGCSRPFANMRATNSLKWTNWKRLNPGMRSTSCKWRSKPSASALTRPSPAIFPR